MVMKEIVVIIQDLTGSEQEWTVPYGCVVSELVNIAGIPPRTPLYNLHGKEVPRDLPLRGRVILKMKGHDIADE